MIEIPINQSSKSVVRERIESSWRGALGSRSAAYRTYVSIGSPKATKPRRLKTSPTADFYIMPGMPPPPIGGIEGGLSSLILEITHSVVKSIPATEAAFSKATLTTLAGSITPA